MNRRERAMRRRADDRLARLVAEHVAEDRHRDESRRLGQGLRRLAAFSVAAAVLVAAALLFLHLHKPPIEASVDSSALSGGKTIKLTDLEPAKPPYLVAALASLVLARDYERDPGDRGEQRVEISIPVPTEACRAITVRIGGSCGGQPAGRPRIIDDLSLTFSHPVHLEAASREARNLWLGTPQQALPNTKPATWTLDVAGPDLTLRLRCFDGSSLHLLGSGLPSRRTECLDGAPLMRIPVRFTKSAEVELGEVRTLYLDAQARSAGVVADDALVSLGDSHTPVRNHGGTALSIRSGEPAGTSLLLDIATAPARSDVSLDSSTAVSVTDAGEERVPSIFSRNSELWLAAAFVMIALIATLWSDVLIRWR